MRILFVTLAALVFAHPIATQDLKNKKQERYPLPYPPSLPGGATIITEETDRFLEPSANLREGVRVASVPPRVDFMYYPGQDHPGKPWSVWGDGCAVGDKYYSAIGDHLSPKGTAMLYEYNSSTRKMRILVNLRAFLVSSGALTKGMNCAMNCQNTMG